MSHMTPEEQAAYDEAAARIAQAKREGSTELELSQLRLTELPPEIGRLTGLRVLDLWDNQLTGVSDCLRELKQLQILDLSRNRLTTVPDWLAFMPALKGLFSRRQNN